MPPSQPHILIVDNNSPFVLPILRSFCRHKSIKVDVLVIAKDKILPFRRSRFVNRLFVRGELTTENLIPLLKDVVRESGAQYLLPTREWISSLLFDNRAELEKIIRVHPVPSSATLQITGDKWKLNQWLDEKGYPSAKATMMEGSGNWSFPCLLKPRIGIGGEGIRRINCQADLEVAMKQVDLSGFFLMEIIEGYDIDISFFAEKGKILVYTMQKGIVSASYTYSRGIKFLDDPKLLELTGRMVKDLNYSGIAHLDFRFSPDRGEYLLVDFNARYWSSLMGSTVMGINFPVWIEAWSAGRHPEKPAFRKESYYFASTAVKTMWKNLFVRNKLKIRIQDTQLSCFINDPIPELSFLAGKLNIFRKS